MENAVDENISNLVGDEHEKYVAFNSIGIYSWARFQKGPIKASDIKETYPILHVNTIDQCIAHLVEQGKFVRSAGLNERSRNVTFDVIVPFSSIEDAILEGGVDKRELDAMINDEYVGKENTKEPDSSGKLKRKSEKTNMSASPKRKGNKVVAKASASPTPQLAGILPAKAPVCDISPSFMDFVMSIISKEFEYTTVDVVKERISESNHECKEEILASVDAVLLYLQDQNKLMINGNDIDLI